MVLQERIRKLQKMRWYKIKYTDERFD